jgi:hypothetical protein
MPHYSKGPRPRKIQPYNPVVYNPNGKRGESNRARSLEVEYASSVRGFRFRGKCSYGERLATELRSSHIAEYIPYDIVYVVQQFADSSNTRLLNVVATTADKLPEKAAPNRAACPNNCHTLID